MDDLNALEQRVEGQLNGFVGPVLPVDDAADLQRHHRREPITKMGSTMFSALKFLAAGVIVALFGGFLLAGILTMPQDGDVLPAAVTEPPSPMTNGEPFLGMVTEEVEPGVFRMDNDGVRGLAFQRRPGGPDLVHLVRRPAQSCHRRRC